MMQTATKFRIEDYFSVADRKDLNAFADFFAEDAVFRFGNYPVWEGRETIRQQIGGIFDSLDAISHRELEVHQCKDKQVIIVNGIVTYKRFDGISKSYPFSATYHLEDERIKRYLVFIDNHDLFD